MEERTLIEGGKVEVSDFGTLALEFNHLSALTRDRTYSDRISQMMNFVEEKLGAEGLLPSTISLQMMLQFH